ncbi:autophagy protein [Cryptotrichosporon argae]
MPFNGLKHPDLLYCNFNQDFTCIAAGHKKGYTILNCDPYGKIHSKNDGGGIAIVEMLFCTSLVALVGSPEASGSSPRKLSIVNTKRQSTICELLFPTSVLAVKMNRKRLVVVLESEIYIYDISTMKLLHTIESGSNPHAVCTLSSSSERSYIAYPSPPSNSAGALSSSAPTTSPIATRTGDVLLFDTLNLSALTVVQAHKNPIAALTLNADGTLLATASEQGTVIRVFSIPSGQKLWQFRRGTAAARIFSLNFNLTSTLLAVSSASSTIHMYKLDGKTREPAGADGSDHGFGLGLPGSAGSYENVRSPTPSDTPSSPASSAPALPLQGHGGGGGGGATSSLRRRSYRIGKSFVGSVGGYLPKGMAEAWESQRDFAHIKLRPGQTGARSVVAISSTTPQVMVIAADGLFQAYSIDLDVGGECSLMKEFSLLSNEEPGSALQVGPDL